MTTPPSPLDGFVGSGPRTRAHTWVRWHSAPMRALERLVPATGAILDLGCGHGLLSLHLALSSAGRSVSGVDLDGTKVHHAAAAVARLGLTDRVAVEQVTSDWRPPTGAFDAAVLVDVLYLMEAEVARGLVAAAVRAVRPGGVVVVKEMADGPRWKRSVVAAQEHVSVRVARITQGATVRLHPEEVLSEALRRAGTTVERHDLGRRRPHPHVALVGTLPGGPGARP